jgi:uncharacterized tellurite resistance protein B-like protein
MSCAGWQIAPNPNLSGLPLTWTEEIAVFPSENPADLHLCGTIRLLYLAVTLAAADGVIEDEEIEAFNKLISTEVRSKDEWQHVKATEVALRRDANVALRALPQISKLIPTERREAVLKTMTHIAAADGEVSLDEINVLRRLARSFGLGNAAVDKILHEDEAFHEVTIAKAGPSRRKGEPVPLRPGAAFQLDQARITALSKETREVISLLSTVMADDPQPQEAGDYSEPEPTSFEADAEEAPDWLEGIDSRYHPAVIELLRHDELSNEDFNSLASNHHLMPDALFNAVNAWGDENFGDFLLERSENVRVFRNLLPATAATTP